MITNEQLTTNNSLDSTLELCAFNTQVFSTTFFPEAFFADFTELHQQLCNAIDSDAEKVVIAAPRGLGKTSLVRSLIIRSILYRLVHFIPYISNSESIAELQTENIKRDLKTNRQIRAIFGDIELDTDDPESDDSFSKRAWSAFGNTLVMPRGAGQQIRGLIYKRFRPDLFVIDDLEKKEELENEANRKKIKDWFHADVEKAVDRYTDKWKMIYIDTLKHHDSLLQELLDSPDWLALRLDICDDQYNSRVPQLFTTEQLQLEAQLHRERGQLDIFYMEYRGLAVAGETASFRPEYFQYFDERDIRELRLESFVIADPAKTVNPLSKETAIVGISVSYKTGAIYVRDVVHGKMYPDQMYEEMFNMARRLNAYTIGVEVTGLEEFIKQPIVNEMKKRGPGYTFEFVWLKARGGPADGDKGKIKRIASLIPYYRQGYIWHNRINCGVLETQLINYLHSTLLDVADATAYSVEMLEIGGRYFDSPEDDPEDIEHEYADLDNEDAIEYSDYTRI